MLWCTLCRCTCSWCFSANPLPHTCRVFLSPVNGSLPADELVAVGAGVLHALVHPLHVHLQLVLQRESSHSFLSPMNRSLPADELVAVGAGVFHALVRALHVHLQLVIQRESSAAHAARVRLQPLSRVLSAMRTLHYNRKLFSAIFPTICNPCGGY
jgi:hypothetical protein